MVESLTSNPFLLALVLLIIGAGLILYLIYFFDRIFVKKRLSRIDVIVLGFNIVLAVYAAINANIAFGQDLKQGMFSAWGKQISIIGVILAQFLLRAKRIPISTIFKIIISLSWISIALNFYISQTVDPRLLIDTDMVGYNPMKGGYVFRFQSDSAMIGVIYYFVSFIVTRKWPNLIGWGIFLSYMLFLDKGRIDIISLCAVMGFAMVRNLSVINFLRTSIVLGTLLTVAGIIIYQYFPGALLVLKNMLMNFVFAIIGIETGEGSIDARFIQFQIVFDYFSKNPGHMVFGTGILNREDMFWRFGEFYLKDIGILGIFFAYGFVGLSALYGLFIYALRLTFKVRVYKSTLEYKLTESIIMMLFISSFFNGGFVWAPGTFLILLLFLHHFSIKEKDLRLSGLPILNRQL
jgi:hypothetical protein